MRHYSEDQSMSYHDFWRAFSSHTCNMHMFLRILLAQETPVLTFCIHLSQNLWRHIFHSSYCTLSYLALCHDARLTANVFLSSYPSASTHLFMWISYLLDFSKITWRRKYHFRRQKYQNQIMNIILVLFLILTLFLRWNILLPYQKTIFFSKSLKICEC